VQGVGLSSGREQVTHAGPRGRSEPDGVGTSFGRWAPGWVRGVVRLAGGVLARGDFLASEILRARFRSSVVSMSSRLMRRGSVRSSSSSVKRVTGG